VTFIVALCSAGADARASDLRSPRASKLPSRSEAPAALDLPRTASRWSAVYRGAPPSRLSQRAPTVALPPVATPWTAPDAAALGSASAPLGAHAATPMPAVSLGAANLLAPPPPDPAAPGATVSGSAAVDAAAPPPQLLGKKGLAPFWIDRDYDTHRTRAIGLPPLFIHRTPKPGHDDKLLHADLSLTFAWYSQSAGRKRWFHPVAFFGGFSERKTVWGSVPLLMGYRRVGEQFNFGQFPLVWWWGTKFVKNFLFVPFHYQQKAPDGYRGVSALLFWHGHRNLHDADLSNDKSHFVAAPVFWRFRRGLRQFDISPVYVGGYNKLSGLRYAAIVPFALWQSREFGNRKELWTLPWIRRTDVARKKSAWAVPLALTFRHSGPERSLLAATPLFWRGRNRLRGRDTIVAGPFARVTDPRQRITIGAPIWWQFEDRQARRRTTIVAPLAFARQDTERAFVFTLLGGGGRSAKGWAAAVPPALTFMGRTDTGTSYQGVAGVMWHVRRPAGEDKPVRDTWIAGPLGYGRRDAKGLRVGVPLAFAYMQTGGPRRYQIFTPLFWHVAERSPERDQQTFVFAPGFHHRVTTPGEGRQVDGGIAPLVFYGRGDRYRYAIVPFGLSGHFHDVKAQRKLTLSPVFVRATQPGGSTLGVGNLFWDVRRPNERHTVAFPVYYRRQLDGRTLTLTPVGGQLRKGTSITTVWGPYARRKREGRDGRGVLPLFWIDDQTTPEGHVRHVVAVPAFLRRRSPEYDLDMISPLVWRSHDRRGKPRRGLAVVPFYFRQRQPGGVDVDAGLGWGWSRDSVRRTHTIVAGPAFHRLSRKGIHAGVVPFYWWHDTQDKRQFVALPGMVHVRDKAAGSHTTIAVPIWFDRKRPNGRRAWGAFPFVFGGKRLHNFTRFSVAPPGYIDVFRVNRNARFVGHAPLLFRYDKCGFRAEDDPSCRYRLWGSFPLFLYGRDGQGRVTHGALAYYFDRREKGIRMWTPVFGVTNWRDEMLAWYAGPVGVRTTPTHRRIFAFPLWYRKAHRLEDRSLTLAAPPLFISRRREDRRFFEAGLLVWQFRQQHKVATAVLPPVFFHSHAYAQRRVTWFLPLFLRDDHWAKDRTWTVLAGGLYTQRRKGENLDLVTFPIVWHIERGKNQGTMGAMVWWDVRVKGTMVQLVPGLMTRVKNATRDTTVLGPGLAWWVRSPDPAGDRSWRALFGAFGAGREGGRRYISIFGGKIWRGGAAAAPAGGNVKASGKVSRADLRRARRRTRAEARQERRAARTAAATQATAARSRPAR
jgi:hypothetical protein